MERSTQHIFYSIFLLALCGMFYFLGLCFQLPYSVDFLIVIVAFMALYQWIKDIETLPQVVCKKYSNIATLLLMLGLFLVVNRGFYLHEKYGLWDAWAFWNIHAKFLADASHWKLFLNPLADAHSDYPLGLPATIAFFSRLFSTSNFVIPFAVTSIVSILIPVIIFLELYRKNLIVAFLMMLWLVTDDFYIQTSLSQYADSWIALYLLCSFIALHHFQKTKNKKILTIAAAFITLTAWTKNEGIMYWLIWLLVHWKIVLKRELSNHVAKGMVLPLIALFTFKFFYAPANDLLAMVHNIPQQLQDSPVRLGLIFKVFLRIMKDEFPLYGWGFVISFFLFFRKKKLMDNEILFMLLSSTGIVIVYLLTPQDLEWQLNTSLDRLMAQLAPLFVYFLGKQLCCFPLPFVQQKSF